MEEREGGPPNARHNPTRLRLLRWILKDPRDYYFFPFLLVFILLLLFQRCERACTLDGAHEHQLVAMRVRAPTRSTAREREKELKERKKERDDEKARRYQREYRSVVTIVTTNRLRVLYTRPRMTLARLGAGFHCDYRRAFKLTVTEVTLGLGQRSLPLRACSISFSAKF